MPEQNPTQLNWRKPEDPLPGQVKRGSDFERELASLINCHSKENGSNTPDFILAAYLVDCLRTFNRTMLWRQKWYSPEGVPVNERIHGPKPGEEE